MSQIFARSGSVVPIAPRIPIMSYFTGAGFLDLGFREHFHSVWHNEYSESFAVGFEYGMRRGPAALPSETAIQVVGSIENVVASDVIRDVATSIPDTGVFGMVGGPPCPDFSVGGKNRGREGDNGKLSQTYVNHICALRPTFFLFENVPGLVRTAKHRAFLDHLSRQLEENGYLLSRTILNALDFGVPQDRQRLFIVGIRREWLWQNHKWSPEFQVGDWFPWPRPQYENAVSDFNWPDVDPFGQNPVRPSGLPDELIVEPLICGDDVLALPNGEDFFAPYSDKFLQIAEGDVSKKSFKRLHRWRYSPTAAYGNNEVHLHPTRARRLSVREALRIQTVPDWFALPPNMSLSAKFKTIGNGVPVLLARKIAESLANMLNGTISPGLSNDKKNE